MESCVSERMGKIWIHYMERILNEEINRDHVDGDVIDGAVGCVIKDEVVQVLNENWKSPWTYRCIIGDDNCCKQGSRKS